MPGSAWCIFEIPGTLRATGNTLGYCHGTTVREGLFVLSRSLIRYGDTTSSRTRQ